jgi:hypothetical protein
MAAGIVFDRVLIDVISTVFGVPLRQLILAAGFAPVLLPARRLALS